MNSFSRRVEAIEGFWETVYGRTGPVVHTFIGASVLLLGLLYLLGSVWMVPASLVHAFRAKPNDSEGASA